MKLLTLSFLFISFSGFSQTESEKLFNQLLKNEQALMDAVAVGDKAVWKKHLHDSCLIAIENGSTIKAADMIAELTPLPPGYNGRIQIIEPKFQLYGNTAVLTFINDEYLELFNQKIHTQYRQTDTWLNVNGNWKIVAMQLFEIPKNPPPAQFSNPLYGQFAGTYELSPERKCVVYVENRKLFAKKNNREAEELFPETETVFFRKSDTRVRIIFTKDKNTGAKLMIERRAGEDLTWKDNDTKQLNK